MSEADESGHLPAGYRLEEFEIERVLGAGGFGVVYLAWDRTLEQRRAIKEFLPGLVAQRGADGRQVTARSGAQYREVYQQGLKHFIREARTLAALDHPNIMKVYRVVEANGTAYLVMPYYEGQTLAEAVKAGPPEPARAQRILAELLDGLRAVHERGLLHRDLKPENIYLVDGERPVLLDFGAARRVVVEGSHSTLNNAYTAGYAAIEQYDSGGEIKEGPWTDLYGLGATIYEWITGNKPWPAPDRVVDDRLKPLGEIKPAGYSRRWLESVDKALELKPRNRHQNVDDWLKTVETSKGKGDGPTPEPISSTGTFRPFSTHGRLGRFRYIVYSVWLALLFVVCWGLFVAVCWRLGLALAPPNLKFREFIMLAILLIPLTCQRLNDFEDNVWWRMLLLVPGFNVMLFLLLLLQPGTQRPNRFGNPPPPNTISINLIALILLAIFSFAAVNIFLDFFF